jgi:dienelactone hydrolase
MQTLISFISNGITIQAELFTPLGTLNGGMIVIAYGTDGMTDNLNGPWATMIRDYANNLAAKGFVALIPNYLSKTSTQPGLSALELINVHRDTWQSTIADAVTHAKTLPGIDTSRIGLLGFSLGGHLCLRLRINAKVLVEFFAPELPELDGIGTSSSSTLHAQIHHGQADALVPYSNAVRIDKEIRASGASSELYPYPGAIHGFLGDDSANANARNQSKVRTLSFFETHL